MLAEPTVTSCRDVTVGVAEPPLKVVVALAAARPPETEGERALKELDNASMSPALPATYRMEPVPLMASGPAVSLVVGKTVVSLLSTVSAPVEATVYAATVSVPSELYNSVVPFPVATAFDWPAVVVAVDTAVPKMSLEMGIALMDVPVGWNRNCVDVVLVVVKSLLPPPPQPVDSAAARMAVYAIE
jgi:hypothetical protein